MLSPEQAVFNLGIIVVLALVFDFINGFHDTANAVATAIATGALAPRQAVLIAAVMNFLGALVFTGVAQNIAGNLLHPLNPEQGLKVIMAALVSASAWNLATWRFGLPSSSSHALIGSLAGAAYTAAGNQGIDYDGFTGAFLALVISPPLAFLTGFCVMNIFYVLFHWQILSRSNRRFPLLQRIAAAFQAFGHGSNDAQKTMGIITLALIIAGRQESLQVPLWVKTASAVTIALGTSAGGWRIIRTVATGITKLAPASGFAADLSSALTIFSATVLHLPVSTTHVISSAITGVGAAGGRHTVKWPTVARMLAAWMLTLPLTTVLGSFCYLLLR